MVRILHLWLGKDERLDEVLASEGEAVLRMEQNDAIGPFLSEWCVQADGAKVAPGRLYDHYKEWHEWASKHGDEPCSEGPPGRYPLSRK